ncbi:MAG: SDR family NAD(P)-dependent oxidoreductase [Planctomycetota bacterium]|nr:SDR family NAD(P)-dependent oxidoreductase [Planctomycetota bacterium]MEC9047001.1 SDR family NAD(P)-dependent oxidoreductase [Planctomycetota bacterium]
MKQVLITGGAGFIGSHVAHRLLAEGLRVSVLDNLDPYYDPAIKRRNLDELRARGEDRFSFLEGDLRDEQACREAVHGCDVVVHLAALAGVRPSLQDPARYMDVNVRGTQLLLNAIADARVRFVFGSSSSVYGGNREVPFSEDHRVDRPVSPYAASKKAGEVLCYTWHHLRGNPVTCLRFFTVYGPGQRPEMAIHKFARMISDGEPIPFFGDGSSRRDYTYVEDIAAGVRAAMEREAGYEIFNLGGSATTSLKELVAQVEASLGIPASLDRQPDQPGDVPITYADVTRAEQALGYRPETPLAEGVKKFCRWYLAEKAAGRVR